MLKDELETIISSDGVWAGRCTLLLAIGILGEYAVLPRFEKANIRLLGLLFKSRRATEFERLLNHWGKGLKIFFALMVVLGIVGEHEFSARVATNAQKLQQEADRELTEATERSTTAISLAGNISNRAERLAALLKTEQETTARFQKQAELAQAALGKQLTAVDLNVRLQGARSKLIRDAHIGSNTQLVRFAGQYVLIFSFGLASDPENNDASRALAEELFFGAKWDARLAYAVYVPDMFGVDVIIDARADSRTRAAARALYTILNEALHETADNASGFMDTSLLEPTKPTDPPLTTNTIIVRLNRHRF